MRTSCLKVLERKGIDFVFGHDGASDAGIIGMLEKDAVESGALLEDGQVGGMTNQVHNPAERAIGGIMKAMGHFFLSQS